MEGGATADELLRLQSSLVPFTFLSSTLDKSLAQMRPAELSRAPTVHQTPPWGAPRSLGSPCARHRSNGVRGREQQRSCRKTPSGPPRSLLRRAPAPRETRDRSIRRAF